MAFGWDDLTMLLGPLLGGLFGGGGGNDSPTTTAEQRALQQEMLKMIQQQSGYMGQMDPLRESVLKMAMGMLPIRYQTAGSFATPKPAGMPASGGSGGVVPTGATNPALGSGEPYTQPGGGMDRSLGAFTPGYDPTLYQPYDPTTGIGHRWGGGGGYGDIVDDFFGSEKGMNPWRPAR